MRYTSSSEPGFSLIELMVAVTLSVLLALAVAPLWIGLQRNSQDGFDRLLDAGRFQVVAARFERDLRLVAPENDLRSRGALVLQAGERQITFVTQAVDGSGLEVVSWEVVGGSLMRRRRPYDPTAGAGVLPGSYSDNKTMVEGLAGGTLHFEFGYGDFSPNLGVPLLRRVERVRLELCFKSVRGPLSDVFVAEGAVGR